MIASRCAWGKGKISMSTAIKRQVQAIEGNKVNILGLNVVIRSARSFSQLRLAIANLGQ